SGKSAWKCESLPYNRSLLFFQIVCCPATCVDHGNSVCKQSPPSAAANLNAQQQQGNIHLRLTEDVPLQVKF
ncbi:hypothetical protein KI387_021882, partial [Taxus chinensis]